MVADYGLVSTQGRPRDLRREPRSPIHVATSSIDRVYPVSVAEALRAIDIEAMALATPQLLAPAIPNYSARRQSAATPF